MTKKHSDKAIRSLANQLEDAKKDGPAAVSAFLSATAFALGAMIPVCVERKGYGDMTAMLIDSLSNGFQTGSAILGEEIDYTVTIVKQEMHH